MKKMLLSAAAVLGLMAGAAQAVTFNGTATADTFFRPGQDGLQVRANQLSNKGRQLFTSTPLNFDLVAAGDSVSIDLYRLVTFEPSLEEDDLVAKPLVTTLDFGSLGSIDIAGTTAGVLGPVPGALASFIEGSIRVSPTLKLVVSIADVLFATDGTAYTAGTATRGTVTATFTLAAVPLPATAPLVLLALGGLAAVARRRKTA